MGRGNFYLGLSLVALATVWLMAFSWPNSNLQIWFFAVGQGDAILIKTPENHQILVDGGPDRTILSKLSRVMPFWDRRLDAIFITHPHADHIAGVLEVLRSYRVEKIFLNPTDFSSPVYEELIRRIRLQSTALESFKQGNRVYFGEVSIFSYWPTSSVQVKNGLSVNQLSMVFRLEYEDFSLLFTGDAELSPDENPELWLESKRWPRVDVIKVPHQASSGALSKEILRRLQPSLAIILVGQNNQFGHPSKEVLNLLEANNVVIKRTDRAGDIVLSTTGRGIYTVMSKY